MRKKLGQYIWVLQLLQIIISLIFNMLTFNIVVTIINICAYYSVTTGYYKNMGTTFLNFLNIDLQYLNMCSNVVPKKQRKIFTKNKIYGK